jgi:hypothetical protein
MRTSEFVGVSAVLVLAGLSGCGGGGGETILKPVTPVPANVSIVDGNNQSAMLRQQLPTPLTVEVVSSTGLGVANIKVDWTVTDGGGMLATSSGSPAATASVVTDNQGMASVNWSVGAKPVAQSVSAAVTGVSSPAIFSAIAVAPPAVLHYDGTTWTTALRDTSDAILSLRSIWGTPSSQILAVGRCRSGPVVLRSNGTGWDRPSDAACASGGSLSQYLSVWGNSASDVFLVQDSPLPPSHVTAILHYNGLGWFESYRRACSFCGGLRAVWSSASNDAIAVGDSGMVLHYDGTGWTSQASGTTKHLYAVWGAGASSGVFAVGEGGTILYYDRTSWQAQASGTTQPLYAVWGTSATDVFAVGAGGTIIHYDGSAWSAQSAGSTQSLRGVWGSSGGYVLAVGDGSTILFFDGARWTSQVALPSMNLTAVWGTSPANVYAIGYQPQ